MSELLRAMTWVVASLLLALPVFAVLNGWLATEQWPVRRLEIQGEFVHVSDAQIQEAVAPHLVKGFFALPLDEVQITLMTLPWVADVQASKRWPDTLVLRVIEHSAAAFWGEDQLLSDEGALFERPTALPSMSMPQFYAQERDIRSVVAMYTEAQRLFAPQQRVVTQVRHSGRGSWSLQLQDGVVVMLGRTEPLERLRRFARTLPEVDAVPGRRWLRADLRYSNGFALKWSAPEAPLSAGMDNT